MYVEWRITLIEQIIIIFFYYYFLLLDIHTHTNEYRAPLKSQIPIKTLLYVMKRHTIRLYAPTKNCQNVYHRVRTMTCRNIQYT